MQSPIRGCQGCDFGETVCENLTIPEMRRRSTPVITVPGTGHHARPSQAIGMGSAPAEGVGRGVDEDLGGLAGVGLRAEAVVRVLAFVRQLDVEPEGDRGGRGTGLAAAPPGLKLTHLGGGGLSRVP